jgi:hypothetical protein
MRPGLPQSGQLLVLISARSLLWDPTSGASSASPRLVRGTGLQASVVPPLKGNARQRHVAPAHDGAIRHGRICHMAERDRKVCGVYVRMGSRPNEFAGDQL